MANEENIVFQKEESDTTHSNWMFGVRIKNIDYKIKKELELFLYNSGIDSRPMFYDITKHKHLSFISCETTNAKILQSQCIILPSYPDLTISQVMFICNKIKKFFKK